MSQGVVNFQLHKVVLFREKHGGWGGQKEYCVHTYFEIYKIYF